MIDRCKIILDICCNHQGDLDLAKKMVLIAKYYCGADAVKFQKRDIETWAKRKKEVYYSPHIDPKNSFGKNYKDHRKNLELSIDQHRILRQLCKEINIDYSCSVFDIKSAKEIIKLKPDIIKIPSACNNNYSLIRYICKNYLGKIHLSTGMTTYDELDDVIKLFIDLKRNKDLVLYICTSGYPLEAKDIGLFEINRLKEKYKDIIYKIGFSSHHTNINFDLIAYAFGADYIERHFTLDRNQKGTDHKISILPEEVKLLINNLKEEQEALSYKGNRVLEVEISNKEKLKW